MFRTVLLSLAFVAGVALTFCAPSAAQAEDDGITYVTEKPQPGEKKRSTSYDKQMRKRCVMVALVTGITRVEMYRIDGMLKLVEETDFKGFSHSTEYGADGKTVVAESYTRDSQKECDYEYNADGSIKVTWYGYSNGNKQTVDEITAKGDVTQTHYASDGTSTASTRKGKREVQKDFVAKTTWFDDTGKARTVEYLNVDRTLKTVALKEDGVTPSDSWTVDRPSPNGREITVAEEQYHEGKVTTDRVKRLDKGLDIRVYQADGKTLRVRQKWNFLARDKDSHGRTTNYVLGTIEEFGPGGKPVLKLILDPLGQKVRVVELFVDGVLTQKRSLRDDAELRVDGTVEKDEFFDVAGKVTSEKSYKAEDGERAMIDGNLLLDPLYQEDEPWK